LSVELTGSRAEGRATERSDWDFCIDTDDFDALASDLPQLLAPLAPLAQQWDRLATHRCWMLILPGPRAAVNAACAAPATAIVTRTHV
jgi:predicted nucleotidyltransferase